MCAAVPCSGPFNFEAESKHLISEAFSWRRSGRDESIVPEAERYQGPGLESLLNAGRWSRDSVWEAEALLLG